MTLSRPRSFYPRMVFVAIAIMAYLSIHAQPGNPPPPDPGPPIVPVTWIDHAGVTEIAGVLTKNIVTAAWTNAGATASNIAAPSTDGFIEFTVSSQRSFMVGFVVNPLFNYNNFANAINIGSGAGLITTYEGATSATYGNVVSGDVLKISREGSEVKYYKNGTVIRTVTVNPALELRPRALIYYNGGATPVVHSSADATIIPRPTITGTGGTASNGIISLTMVGGTAPYTYSWSTGETTSSISGKPVGTYTITVTDNDGRVNNTTFSIGYKTLYPDLNGVTESSGVLTKTGANGWNASGSSSNLLPPNTDGWVEFVATNFGPSYVIGYGLDAPGNSYTSLRNGFNINSTNGTFYTYEGGTGTNLGYWRMGDVFRISREGTSMRYYRNGALVRTVTTDPTVELRVRTVVYSGSTPLVCSSVDGRIIPQPAIAGTGPANGTGGIALSPIGGTAPYAYNWSSGEQTGAINNKNRGTYSVTITDAEGRVENRSFELQYKPVWVDKVNVNENAGGLTKTSGTGWNSGALTANVLPANTDGWVEFVLDNFSSFFAIGFDLSNKGLNNTDYKNCFYMHNGNGLHYIYEGTGYVLYKAWRVGDIFRIAREGSSIKYYRNGALVRTIATNPALEVRVKASIYSGSTPELTTSFDAQPIVNPTIVNTGPADGTGSISLNVSGGPAPFTYVWSSGETTAAISDKNRGNYQVTVTDAEGRAISHTYDVGYETDYINKTLVTESNGILTRSGAAAWNAGANSSNFLPANTDGWIEFIAENGTSTFEIGFGNNLTGFSNTDFKHGFALYYPGSTVSTYEGATAVAVGGWKAGDVFRIARQGNTVRYYQNEVVLRTLPVDPNTILRAKTSVNTGSSPVVNLSFDAQLQLSAAVNGTDYADGTGNITLSVTGGTAPYSYSWSSGESTASIANKNRGQYTVSVTDASGRVQAQTYSIGYKSFYADFVSTTENAGTLSKTSAAGWNAGANISNILPANTDGWIEFVAGSGITYEVGFSATRIAFNYSDFLHGLGIFHATSLVYSYEGATATLLGSWNPGDVFKIAREGSTIKYYRNGLLLRSVAANTAYDLQGKVSINSSGSTPLVSASFDTRVTSTASVLGTGSADGTGSILVTPYTGQSPYSYSWVSGEQQNSISGKARGLYTATVTDAVGRQMTRTYSVGYKPNWINHTNATENNGELTRTGSPAWNAGAYSSTVLAANANGWAEFSANHSGNHIIGFATNLTSYNYNSFTHGIYVHLNGFYQLYEGGTLQLTGSYQRGDVFRVSREGAQVRYYRNGAVVRTVAVSANVVLRTKVSIHAGSSSLVNTSSWILASEGQVPDIAEFNALKDIYNNLGGSAWTTKTNWPTTWPASATSAQFGTWHGVTVSNGDITTLNFTSNNLTGTIPASIGNLVSLTNLHLGANQIAGNLPVQVSDLGNLRQLALESNQLTGSLPSTLGNLTQLTHLTAHWNQISGPIPATISNMIALQHVSLHGNAISGSIPSGIGNLSQLNLLYLQSNQLSGSIPSEIGNLTNLQYLLLSYNSINGPIPTTIGNMSSLTTLGLDRNQLSGPIPVELGDLTSLTNLSLQVNQLTGSIPLQLGNLSSLTGLALSYNQLSGKIPGKLSDLSQLQTLYLDHNQLTGTIPPSLGELTNLMQLHLSSNEIESTIPVQFANLNSLTQLLLDNNKLSGEIPEGIVQLPALSSLQVQSNDFTALGNFTQAPNKANLQLDVSDNRLLFGDLEQNFTAPGVHPFNTFTYAPQKPIDEISSIHVPGGEGLEILAKGPGQYSSVTWERRPDASSAWVNINSQNEDASQLTFVNSDFQSSQAGQYRYKMTNASATGVTLESEPIEVIIVDPLPATNVAQPLFNGFIASMRWRTDEAYNTGKGEYRGMYAFRYDNEYQIKEANWANALDLPVTTNQFRLTNMNYDPNGNILSLRRFNQASMRKHDFLYTYNTNATARKTNRLESIPGYSNYQYNSIGEMIADDKSGSDDKYVEYDVAGKARKVFKDAAHEDLKVEFVYDDRGFRLAKVNYETGRTTWYIRDGSGNVISVYEQEGVIATQPDGTPVENTEVVTQTEVPVYGSAKIGTYYPDQDGSVAYEVTDHLGNVRALVRDNIAVYRATMEDNGQPDITNPAVEELYYFDNLIETGVENQWMNHTAPMPGVPAPERVAKLYWNDTPGTLASEKSVGPSIALQVNAGDVIEIETWARYEQKPSYSKDFMLSTLSSFLGNNFAYVKGFENFSVPQASQSILGALVGAGYPNDGADNSRPFAYLNYILYDENMISQTAGWVRVTDDAAYEPQEAGMTGMHEHLKFSAPIEITQKGYIYVWVSNETANTDVWFDDLTVKHTGVMVTQATDYGAWGDILRDQKTDENEYRFGYQGQFSEKDIETTWNHFQLREYDAEIGRWVVVDPKRQYPSPYLSYGNNPINKVDPTGGCDGCPLFRHVTANDNVTKLLNLQVMGSIDLGIQVQGDMGPIGGEIELIAADIVKGRVDFYFDFKNGQILWDVTGNSIFVDLATKKLNFHSEAYVDLAGIAKAGVSNGRSFEEMVAIWQKSDGIIDFVTEYFSNYEYEWGNPFVKMDSNGDLMIGADVGYAEFLGFEAEGWLKFPKEWDVLTKFIQDIFFPERNRPEPEWEMPPGGPWEKWMEKEPGNK